MQKSDFVQKFVNEKLKKKKNSEDDEETQLLRHDDVGRHHHTDSSPPFSSTASESSDDAAASESAVKRGKKSMTSSTGKKGLNGSSDVIKDGKYGSTSKEVELDTSKHLASYANEKKRKSGGNRKSTSGGHHHDHGHGHGHDHGHDHGHGHKHEKDASTYSESDHCHDSSDERSVLDEKKRRKAMKKLLMATGLSCVFMIGEIVGGYLANSLAIMTDASHLLTDVSSFLISIIALKMASRPISTKMTFGWHRAEVIGALISVLAIWILTGILVYLAIDRVITNEYTVEGETMLITAAVAVGFNVLLGLVLHEHGHSHGGHSHDPEHGHHHHDDESGNVNVRAAFIHVIGDLLQSLGVLSAAFIIYFKPEYKIADPICTFLFSVLVLFTTITILRDTVVVIMEGTPVGVKYDVVKEKLLEIPGVTAVHDLRIWSLTLNQTVMSAHLAIDKNADQNIVLKRATRRLKALYDFHSLTLQVEYYSTDMVDCKQCKPAT